MNGIEVCLVFKENLNVPRPSEHPLSTFRAVLRGDEMKSNEVKCEKVSCVK